ncbi:phosphotransferase [uncultured Methylobacterium sp.]|uniref:phosphotransferase n=1 Tax=uncultured Methylobacterium sp. TaxID=157278 RepID=UPI0035CACF89
MMIPSDLGFEERIAAACAEVQVWQGRAMRFTLAAAPVASPTHRAVASDCVRVQVEGSGTVFLKVRHADMEADILPTMPEATRRAGRLGLGPAVLVEAQGVLGLEDLSDPWRYARVGDLQDADTMGQVLAALRRLHDAEPLGQNFCPFARITRLAEEARACAAPLPDDIDSLLESAASMRAAIRAAGFDRAFCRNDGTASNIMLNPVPGGIVPGGVRLIDFDLAGDNDPWYEIGALLNEAYSFDAERRQAIEIYAGTYDERLFHRARLYGAVDDLMWGLWGITRAITARRSGIEFFKYGQWRLLHARTTIAARDFELWLRRL